MKLNHLDLQVPDVQSTTAALERLFQLRLLSNRTSPALVILTDGEGFTLVLQQRAAGSPGYPEGFHLGFLVDDDESVMRAFARAQEEGLRASPPSRNARGLMTYVHVPGDLLVEVSHRG